MIMPFVPACSSPWIQRVLSPHAPASLPINLILHLPNLWFGLAILGVLQMPKIERYCSIVQYVF